MKMGRGIAPPTRSLPPDKTCPGGSHFKLLLGKNKHPTGFFILHNGVVPSRIVVSQEHGHILGKLVGKRYGGIYFVMGGLHLMHGAVRRKQILQGCFVERIGFVFRFANDLAGEFFTM